MNPVLVRIVGTWLLVFGTWPLADPGHWPMSLLVATDLILHAVGVGLLLLARHLTQAAVAS